jgi:hypothetical protein
MQIIRDTEDALYSQGKTAECIIDLPTSISCSFIADFINLIISSRLGRFDNSDTEAVI